MQELLSGLFVNDALDQADYCEQIHKALETETVDAATQQYLIDNIWGLEEECLDAALCVLNAGPPVGDAWHALVDRAVKILAGRNREDRRYAALFLLHVAGGRVGAGYSVHPHPKLETEAGWEALIKCLTDKDNVLRRKILEGIGYTFGHSQFLRLVLDLLQAAGQTDLLNTAYVRALENGQSLSGVAAVPPKEANLPFWRVLQMILEGEHDHAVAVLEEKRYFESIMMSLSNPAICKSDQVQQFFPRLLGLICKVIQTDPQEKYANAFSIAGILCCKLAAENVDLTPWIDVLCTSMQLTKNMGRVNPPAATAAICLAHIQTHNKQNGPSVLSELMESKGGHSGFAPFGLAIQAWLLGDETQLWELVRHTNASVRARTVAAFAHIISQLWVKSSTTALMKALLATLAEDKTARIAKTAQAAIARLPRK
ncbi:MAG: hypothetical protein R3B84_22885 [Zavarzinella sp.]